MNDVCCYTSHTLVEIRYNNITSNVYYENKETIFTRIYVYNTSHATSRPDVEIEEAAGSRARIPKEDFVRPVAV